MLEYFVKIVVDVFPMADIQNDDMVFNVVHHVDSPVVSHPKAVVG